MVVLEVVGVLLPVVLPRLLWGRAQQRRLSELVSPRGLRTP
jgi:type II secretory pathway pseudopilin PulG